MNEDKATILDIQRLSTEDGPGIRTTIFFKGCNLACAWCHNPESIAYRKQIQWQDARCIGCNICLAVCPNKGLHKDTDNAISIDRTVCSACATCVGACPAGAMEVKGEDWELEPLAYEVLKDRAFWGEQGGVTLSGGEVLLQHAFAERFLRRLKQENIHTAIDTAGLVSWDVFEKIIPYTDLFLLDLKLMDAQQHKLYTRVDNARILDNATRLAAYIREHHTPTLWIRTPIIPGASDTNSNIAAIGTFIDTHMQGAVARWELCAFNNLCTDKYRRLDENWSYAGTPLVTKEQMEALAAIGRSKLMQPDILIWTGTTKLVD